MFWASPALTLTDPLKNHCFLFNPSIHPLSNTYPGSGRWAALAAGGPSLFSPWPHQPALTRGSWGIPRSVRRYNLAIWTWVCPMGLFPAGHAWNTSLWRRPGGFLTRCPPTTSIGSFQRKVAAALLQVPHGWLNFSPYPWERRQPPSWGNPFQLIISAFSQSWPILHDLGEGSKEDWQFKI